MARRKELDDYAETAVLPEGLAPTMQRGATADAMTVTAVEHLLRLGKGQPLAAESGTDLEAVCNPSAAEAHARYDEYLRYLDELPVLSDVVSEPPRVRIRDFRRGERPDVRKHAREDPYTVRELHAAELEQRYREYVEVLGSPQTAGMTSSPPAAGGQNGRRKPVRKQSRAKRPKRSKRGK